MASEITASVTLSSSKGGVSISNTFPKISDMAGDEMIGNVQTVGTSAEAVVLGDLSTVAYLLVANLDSTNYVEVDAVNTFDAFPQKIPAGKAILLSPQTTTIYTKANTSACRVYFQAVEL